MQVLTYVNGVLTVIKGDEFFRDTHPKPSFIVGEEFYFEPTLMITQGRELTPSEISKAEAFINDFVFPKVEVYNPKEVHAVDKYGNYLGRKVLGLNEFEVPSAPSEIRQGIAWDFDAKEWYEYAIVDTRSGVVIGTGLNTSFAESTYIKASLVDTTLCLESQRYDFGSKKIIVNIDVVRTTKKQMLSNDFSSLVNSMIGDSCLGEMTSWRNQESEAKAWISDDTTVTPFIDALLIGRGFGETKSELVAKIIEKADAYKENYALLLGKFHSKLKEIENATTVAELKAITW